VRRAHLPQGRCGIAVARVRAAHPSVPDMGMYLLIAVFVSSDRAAERVLGRLTRWLHKHLDLEVNAAKSGAHRTEETALLGFRIHPGGPVSPAPKAIERLKERVRMLWDAGQSLTTAQLRDQWQRYITGWWNYYGYANWRREVHALSGWIRRHMRKCFWLNSGDSLLNRGWYYAEPKYAVPGTGSADAVSRRPGVFTHSLRTALRRPFSCPAAPVTTRLHALPGQPFQLDLPGFYEVENPRLVDVSFDHALIGMVGQSDRASEPLTVHDCPDPPAGGP